MLALHRRLGGRAAVSCPSNLGMDCQGLTPRGRVFSLEEQVAHKQVGRSAAQLTAIVLLGAWLCPKHPGLLACPYERAPVFCSAGAVAGEVCRARAAAGGSAWAQHW